MFVVYLMLYLGAFFLAAFTATFVIGSLFGLVGLVKEALRPAAKLQDVKAVSSSARLASKPHVAQVETTVDMGAEYAWA
jgi:hypothetical protein